MLILAGVSINAIVGEDGIIGRATTTTLLSDLIAVQEAYDIWCAGNKINDLDDKTRPTKNIASTNLINDSKTGRLYGEIAYYRLWAEYGEEPPIDAITSSTESFNEYFLGDLYGMGSSVLDLYVLDLDAIGYESDNTYLIDVTNDIIYRVEGQKIKGVDVHSLLMLNLINSGDKTPPIYADSENIGPAGGRPLANEYDGKSKYLMDSDGNYINESGQIVDPANKVENPNCDENSFRFITSPYTTNIYKLYNDGRLYGKGLKGIGLQTSQDEMNKIDDTVYQKFTIPSEIPSVSKIIHGSGTMYVIDNDGNLWAWGTNNYNKLGLTQEQQVIYTGREPVQINVGGNMDNSGKVTGSKSVYNVFDIGSWLFVVTNDNLLYVAGKNDKYSCGLGHNNLVEKLTPCTFSNPKNIYQISAGGDTWYGITIWYNNSPSSVTIGTQEWSNNNKFFYAGPQAGWGLGEIKKTSYETFSRIWDGNDGQNIATQIKEGSTCSHGAIFLLHNGQIVQCGYSGRGVGSGWIGTGVENGTLKNRGDIKNKAFSHIWVQGSSLVGLATDGTIWGTSTSPKIVFGETTIDYLMHQLTVPFNTSNLKEVQNAGNCIFYLLNDGTVYASGHYSSMGLGSDWTETITGCVNLSNGTYAKSFPKINSFYGGNSNLGILEKETNSNGKYNLTYIGTDGNIYMLGNSNILFRNNILEKNWVLVATNVAQFEVGASYGYVDFDGRVYVAGENSKHLGLNYSTNQKVKKFTEITQREIKGKAKKIQFGDLICGILTTDGKLYVTGENNDGNNSYFGLGIDNIGTIAITDFQPVKYNNVVVTDVRDYSINSSARILQKNNGEVYAWGSWNSWKHGNAIASTTLTKSNSNIGKIVDFFTSSRTSKVIDENGKLWYAGDDSNMMAGHYSNTDYAEFTGEFNNEKILQYEWSGNHFVLTESGKVYGWGTPTGLGINSTDTVYSNDIKDLGISNVNYIVAGSGYIIAVKNDGTVWGTGTNQYGVLGRWKGSTRKGANSRYRTAFEWVECPELEI